jgi:LAO/AO transport system kinase
MLDFAPHEAWRPPIVKTSAPQGAGVPDLVEALEAHGRHLEESGEAAARRAGRARSRLLALLEGRFRKAVEAKAPEPDGLEEAVRAVASRAEDPYAAADRLFEGVVRPGAATAGRRP